MSRGETSLRIPTTQRVRPAQELKGEEGEGERRFGKKYSS